jgi:hypothetical protein
MRSVPVAVMMLTARPAAMIGMVRPRQIGALARRC